MDLLFVSLKVVPVHFIKDLKSQLNVCNQAVTAVLAEVLTDDNTHQLKLLAVWGHCVGGNNPATLTELMSNSEFIVKGSPVLVKAESNQRQTLAASFTHYNKTEFLKLSSQVVSGASEVNHNSTVTMLAQADHLIVLANNLGCSLGEVKSETSLLSTKVVDVEDKLLGQEFRGSPNDPTNTRVDL